MNHPMAMRLATRLDHDVPRMRHLLNHDAEFDRAAMLELLGISSSLRDFAEAVGDADLSRAAERLLLGLRRLAMPSRHISTLERLGLWRLILEFRTRAARLH
jgi:hypothetical protein